MFGIGFFELLVIAVLGLLVFGPEKLPEAIRTLAFGMAKVKRSWLNTRRELEQELGMDEIRREIHNAQVMSDLEKNEQTLRKLAADQTIDESDILSDDKPISPQADPISNSTGESSLDSDGNAQKNN